MNEELKEMYVSLSRAVEEGDNLRLGIVIGQVLCKLEQIINDADQTNQVASRVI